MDFLAHSSRLAVGFKSEQSRWVVEHMCGQLCKMPLNSFLSGGTHSHFHQRCAVHTKPLLALSVVSPQNCTCQCVFADMYFFMVLTCAFSG